MLVDGRYVGRLSLPVNPLDGNQLHQLRNISDCVRHAIRQREKLICDTQVSLENIKCKPD